MFLEHQISIELFLKDHVTLKTEEMILKIQICHHLRSQNKRHFKIETVNNNSQYYIINLKTSY